MILTRLVGPTAALICYMSLYGVAVADIRDDIGHARLAAELGRNLPDGSGVSVIQVEAAQKIEGDGLAYAPDPQHEEFSGKQITDVTGAGTRPSGHATAVARIFVGDDTSIAPGISQLQSFNAPDWYLEGFLIPRPEIGSLRPQPAMMSARLGNHSFVGSYGNLNAEILARLDWVIETDEFIQVVGYNGSKNPVAASAFNVISVDHTSAGRTRGTVDVDEDYTGKRTAPHLVVPERNPSRATPWVAAAAALLIETAHDNPRLSNETVANRSGVKVYNAGRSEVIKAALMAGARRVTMNTSEGQIEGYRDDPANRTDNGLDRRYGAGQLDVYHSYRMIAAGEQNSDEDRVLGKGRIKRYGFDYDPQFGGAFDSNPQATYFFSTGKDELQLQATLVWNIDIDGGIDSIFIAAPTLHDLNLTLYDASDDNSWQEIASSQDTRENTETIATRLASDTDYALRVTGVGEFRHDYAVAWQLTDE